MQIRLFRHATCWVEYSGKRLLLDPVFSPAESLNPIANSANTRRNPLVALPAAPAEICAVDAVVLTHLHPDHFDAAARESLPRTLPVFCQPDDAEQLAAWGFRDVRPVATELLWEGIKFVRTGGEHGHGEIAERLAPVAGFVLQSAQEAACYIIGDSVWCPAVAAVLAAYQPATILAYGGEARYQSGLPITMGLEDLWQVHANCPDARLVVVHMEAWNHCGLMRADVQAAWRQHGRERLYLPQDGEWVHC